MPKGTKKRLRKPPQVQQAVIGRYLSGDSKRQISRDLGIHRGTVDRILTENQVEEAVARSRSELVELLPDAAKLYARAIRDGLAADEVPKAALDVVTQLFKGIGIFEDRTRSDVRVSSYTDVSDDELRQRIAERLGWSES